MATATATRTAAPAAFPEIGPALMAEVDRMLLRLHATQWAEATCLGRRLVRATAHGPAATRHELRRAERLLTGGRR